MDPATAVCATAKVSVGGIASGFALKDVGRVRSNTGDSRIGSTVKVPAGADRATTVPTSRDAAVKAIVEVAVAETSTPSSGESAISAAIPRGSATVHASVARAANPAATVTASAVTARAPARLRSVRMAADVTAAASRARQPTRASARARAVGSLAE